MYNNFSISKVWVRSLRVPDSTEQAVPPAAYENSKELKLIWSELQTALQNGNWETLSDKMQKIEELLDKQ